MNQNSSESPDLFFDVELRPYRSLGPVGFFLLMLIIVSVSFIAGLFFVSKGAWPVMGFFGLDVLAIYLAFKFNYRSGKIAEFLQLTNNELIITRVEPSGKTNKWNFHPSWIKVQIKEYSNQNNRLILSSHGSAIQIGSFLSSSERREIANELKNALVRWKQSLIN